MTDKEIAGYLATSRFDAAMAKSYVLTRNPDMARMHAYSAVNRIHHIINSINWED